MNFYNLIDLKTHLLNNIRRCVFVYLEPTIIKQKFKREKHIYKLFNQKIIFIIIIEKLS